MEIDAEACRRRMEGLLLYAEGLQTGLQRAEEVARAEMDSCRHFGDEPAAGLVEWVQSLDRAWEPMDEDDIQREPIDRDTLREVIMNAQEVIMQKNQKIQMLREDAAQRAASAQWERRQRLIMEEMHESLKEMCASTRKTLEEALLEGLKGPTMDDPADGAV